jgi:hypothetical protein
MSEVVQIHVAILDECVDVWRPVQAEHLRDSVYRILDQSYDGAIESWQFKPGDEVLCEMVPSSDGLILGVVATWESG